jgi:hypothetical protein
MDSGRNIAVSPPPPTTSIAKPTEDEKKLI